MSDEYIKFTYDAQALVLNAQVSADALKELEDDPGKFVGGARLKMAGLLEEKAFERFIIHENRFLEAWKVLRKNLSKAPVQLKIASGLPDIPHCTLRANPSAGGAVFEFKGNPDHLAHIQPHWLLSYLQEMADQFSSPVQLNPADVHAAWYRIRKNQIHHLKMEISPAYSPSFVAGNDYIVKTRRDIGSIEILFSSAKAISEPKFSSIIDEVKQKASSLSAKGGESGFYACFDKNIRSSHQLLKRGYHKLGLGFPVSVLGALTHKTDDRQAAAPLRDALWFSKGKGKPTLAATSDLIDEANQLMLKDGLKDTDEQVNHALTRTTTKPFSPGSSGFHKNILSSAKAALNSLPSRERDFESLTIAIDESSAQKLISYLHEIVEKLPPCSTPETEVGSLSMQLFPLTRIKIKANDPPGFRVETTNDIWQKLILRELVGLDTFRRDFKWVSGKLLLPIEQSDYVSCMDQLKARNFIFVDPAKGGKLCQTQKNILTGDNVTNEALAEYHQIMIDSAIQAMDHPYASRCDFISCFFRSNEEHRQKVIAAIKDFLSELFKETGEAAIPDQLYHLGIQLFPILKSNE